MGGKKKGGGGKKGGKKKGGDDDGEIDPGVLNDILAGRVAILKAQLVREQERRDAAESSIDLIRDDANEMNTNMDGDHQKTREMVSKMTQIYKNMEKGFNEEIAKHEAEVAQQERTKKSLKEEIGQLQQAKEDMITDYEGKIFMLKERIDTMSSDFAKMLKTTLKKMQERIDDANQTYDGDQPGVEGGPAAGGMDDL